MLKGLHGRKPGKLGWGSIGWLIFAGLACGSSQVIPFTNPTHATTDATNGASVGTGGYVLGPGDEVVVRAVDVDEFEGKPLQIDAQGYIDVPLVGRVKAGGLTAGALQSQLTEELKQFVKNPAVSVTVANYKSGPVSVVGAVIESGMYPLNGQNTLVQVLSQAKGLSIDAGSSIEITRSKAWGTIPLPDCKEDTSGKYYTAHVDTKLLMQARDPDANIKILPGDVISVPKAELIYVVGAVNKAGAFALSQRSNITVLQALSMSEGLDKTASATHARIIHQGPDNRKVEVPVDLSQILSGHRPDVQLLANDILFVPTSGVKTVGYRALEAAVQAATGVLIYRP